MSGTYQGYYGVFPHTARESVTGLPAIFLSN